MFRIGLNNQVNQSRGQSAVYQRAICRNDRYLTPYILPPSLKNYNPKIRLIIKANRNDNTPVLGYEGEIADSVHWFDTQQVIELEDITKADKTKNVLYRFYNNATQKYEFGYFASPTDTEPTLYNFLVNVTIDAEDTLNLTPATYYYTLELVTTDEEGNVDYKDVWISPTEWTIGGSY